MHPNAFTRHPAMNQLRPSHKPLAPNDWAHLNTGDAVTVKRAGEPPLSGEVDDVSDDAKIFWVQLHDGRGRILVCAGDGSVVTRN